MVPQFSSSGGGDVDLTEEQMELSDIVSLEFAPPPQQAQQGGSQQPDGLGGSAVDAGGAGPGPSTSGAGSLQHAQQLAVVCQYCHRPQSATFALLRCSGCDSVWYCDEEHQRQHWATHKVFCKRQQRRKKRAAAHDQIRHAHHSHAHHHSHHQNHSHNHHSHHQHTLHQSPLVKRMRESAADRAAEEQAQSGSSKSGSGDDQYTGSADNENGSSESSSPSNIGYRQQQQQQQQQKITKSRGGRGSGSSGSGGNGSGGVGIVPTNPNFNMNPGPPLSESNGGSASSSGVSLSTQFGLGGNGMSGGGGGGGGGDGGGGGGSSDSGSGSGNGQSGSGMNSGSNNEAGGSGSGSGSGSGGGNTASSSVGGGSSTSTLQAVPSGSGHHLYRSVAQGQRGASDSDGSNGSQTGSAGGVNPELQQQSGAGGSQLPGPTSSSSKTKIWRPSALRHHLHHSAATSSNAAAGSSGGVGPTSFHQQHHEGFQLVQPGLMKPGSSSSGGEMGRSSGGGVLVQTKQQQMDHHSHHHNNNNNNRPRNHHHHRHHHKHHHKQHYHQRSQQPHQPQHRQQNSQEALLQQLREAGGGGESSREGAVGVGETAAVGAAAAAVGIGGNIGGKVALIDHSLNKPYSTTVEEHLMKTLLLNPQITRYDAFCQRVSEISKFTKKRLNDYGWCAVDHFLGPAHASAIYGEAHTIYLKNKFIPGSKKCESSSLGESSNCPSTIISRNARSDLIYWHNPDGDDMNSINISFLVQMIDSVMSQLAHSMPDFNIAGRSRAQLSIYRSNGWKYEQHVDDPFGQGRILTVVYYINQNWTQLNGGVLELFPTSSRIPVKISPQFDRLLLFWSDSRNPHKVHQSTIDRYAIALWYFDGVAKEKSEQKLRRKRRKAKKAMKTLLQESIKRSGGENSLLFQFPPNPAAALLTTAQPTAPQLLLSQQPTAQLRPSVASTDGVEILGETNTQHQRPSHHIRHQHQHQQQQQSGQQSSTRQPQPNPDAEPGPSNLLLSQPQYSGLPSTESTNPNLDTLLLAAKLSHQQHQQQQNDGQQKNIYF